VVLLDDEKGSPGALPQQAVPFKRRIGKVPSMADPVPVARSRSTVASMVGVIGSAITSLLATLCCVGPVA